MKKRRADADPEDVKKSTTHRIRRKPPTYPPKNEYDTHHPNTSPAVSSFPSRYRHPQTKGEPELFEHRGQ